MSQEPTKLNSILHNSCPRCGEGNVWPSNNPFMSVFVNKGETNKSCDSCNLRFEKGPGFWYGAMYASYAIGVAIFVAAWVATAVLLPEDASLWLQMGIIGGSIIVLAPVNYYFSRLIWLNVSVTHKPNEKPSKTPTSTV